MKLLNTARSLPLSTRRFIVTVSVAVIAVVGFSTWIAFDFGIPGQQGGLRAISDGASSVAQLVQDQTDKYSETRAQLEANLDQTLKSSALILPESLAEIREEPDGVLFLGYQHRASGVLTTLDDVTFYPSYTLVRATITNESDTAVSVDAGRGSIIEQPNGDSTVAVQPIYQSGTPAELTPGDQVQTQIVFSPLNGRSGFTLVIGDYTAVSAGAAEVWSSRFEVDPGEVVDQDPPQEPL